MLVGVFNPGRFYYLTPFCCKAAYKGLNPWPGAAAGVDCEHTAWILAAISLRHDVASIAASAAMQSDDHFSTWKDRMVPLMYDTFYHHNLHWPTQACR